MPNSTEFKNAVDWALEQEKEEEIGLIKVKNENGKINKHYLVHFVSKYFAENNIENHGFSYQDLKQYL